MMLTTPVHIEGNEVMGARMKEHVYSSFSQSFQVSGYEDLIGNVSGKVLEVFPGAARLKNELVEIGSEMTAGKPTSFSGLH